MKQHLAHFLNDEEVLSLIRRMNLAPSLVRRHLEEEITHLVNLSAEVQAQAVSEFCGDQDQESLLSDKGWTEADLQLNVLRPLALRRFASQRFGPGLEERFLGFKEVVIRSFIRYFESEILDWPESCGSVLKRVKSRSLRRRVPSVKVLSLIAKE